MNLFLYYNQTHCFVFAKSQSFPSFFRVQDLPREIQRLSEFLGISVTDSLVEGICDVTQVNKMKDDYNNRGWRFKVRKGQVGDWKNWLTVAQSEAIDNVIKDKMADLSIYKPRYTLP
ncbi:cytosolic sulfotransferase 1-like [Aplysia californica]|uniref:Cytosolic sulfotransferase 1-like n=1 Tax=Aplysia californica TaxID=6500 RepID=A0ABM1VWW3_APLCA|nr:cytosolic sulfotransferase 1-like [Aplysia californica]